MMPSEELRHTGLEEVIQILKGHVDGLDSARFEGFVKLSLHEWDTLKTYVDELDRRMK